MVSEVNAISEELNKHKSFEVVLISAAAQEGSGKGQGTQYVNLTALELLTSLTFHHLSLGYRMLVMLELVVF